MKLTRQQILNLHNGLHATGHLTGIKFAYASSKNLSKIKSEIDAIQTILQKVYKSTPESIAYEKERIALAEKHAEKIDGKPKRMTENGIEKFVIIDKKAFNEESDDLKKKHKIAVEDIKKQEEDFKSFLEEEIKIDLHKINIKDVPKEITAKQMNDIFSIID